MNHTTERACFLLPYSSPNERGRRLLLPISVTQDTTSICTYTVLLRKKLWELHPASCFAQHCDSMAISRALCVSLIIIQYMASTKFYNLNESFDNTSKNKWGLEWLNEVDTNKKNSSKWYQKTTEFGWYFCVFCRHIQNENNSKKTLYKHSSDLDHLKHLKAQEFTCILPTGKLISAWSSLSDCITRQI